MGTLLENIPQKFQCSIPSSSEDTGLLGDFPAMLFFLWVILMFFQVKVGVD